MQMDWIRVGTRRQRLSLLKMDICSIVSRKDTQFPDHASSPVVPEVIQMVT